MNRILLIALLFPLLGLSQKKQDNKAYLRSILSGGLLIGEKDSYPVYQWSGGLHINRYFGGVGIGYDRYRFNSIPVFADFRADIGEKKLVYVYANGGYAIPGKYKELEEFNKIVDKLKGGFYMDLGVGYRMRLSPVHSILLSAGYTRKEMTQEKIYKYSWCPTCDESIYRFNYKLDRIVVKASWEFGR